MGLGPSKDDTTAAGEKDVRTVNMSQLRELGERCYLHLDQLDNQAEASEAALRLQQNLLLNILDENQKRKSGTLPKVDISSPSEHGSNVDGATSIQSFKYDKTEHASNVDGAKANILDECDYEVDRQQDTLIDERLEIILRDSRDIVLRQAHILRNSFELFKGFIEDKLEHTHSQRLNDCPNTEKETIQTLKKQLRDIQYKHEQTSNLLKSTETARKQCLDISQFNAKEIEKRNFEIEARQDKNTELTTECHTLKVKIQDLEEENRNLNKKVRENESKLFNRHDTYQNSSSGGGWVSLPRKSAVAQLYCPRIGDLTSIVSSEVTSMLINQFLTNQTDLTLIPCENASQLSPDKPGIVLCLNASRLGTDVYNALQGVNVSHRLAVVILHHKDLHALPNQPSYRVLTSPEYKALGGIFDMAFLSGKGIYPCDMNNTAVASIMHFIRHNNNL